LKPAPVSGAGFCLVTKALSQSVQIIMIQTADDQATRDGFRVHLEDEDISALMQTLLASKKRVQQVKLSSGTVWIKRQGTEKPSWWVKSLGVLAKLLPYAFMRPSPTLDPTSMMRREIDAMERFAAKGFPVPQIIYASDTAMILSDAGLTIAQRLDRLEDAPAEHDALMVECAAALGDLHTAGLCHGRPHVRDFFMQDGRIGFMDFEELPQAVMPLETAQARDLWLLFLPLSTRVLNGELTLDAAYRAWAARAPQAAISELRRLTMILGRFLPLARLIGRVQMGSDLRRFIVATDFLMNALKLDAIETDAGKAGQNDRT
jgi:tRNA A-37 threonylcarbamoyl transferase component Bud32